MQLNSHDYHAYLLWCENAIPNVQLADGADKRFHRIETLASLILVLA